MTITINDFGKDHWSTFAYIETVCVDNRGVPDKERMRCNPKIHPGLCNQANVMFQDQPDYPTRLSGYFLPNGEKDRGRLLHDHDDWSCAEDLEAAGLIEWIGSGVNPVFKMTTYGLVVAGRLRAHKASGGHFATFDHG
jgi:hypothetical protein